MSTPGSEQPQTFACPGCNGLHFVVMFGGALTQPKLKCAGCGTCWFIAKEGGAT